MNEQLCKKCKNRFAPISQSSCWACHDNSHFIEDKPFRNPQIEILERDNEPHIICGATGCIYNSGVKKPGDVHYCKKIKPVHISCMIVCDDYTEKE